MGFGPQLVDLDGDGFQDLISGSWPGELFFFGGSKDGGFAPAVMLKDAQGAVINIGGGIHEEADGTLLITGHATFEKTDEGTFVDYHGKRIRSTPAVPVAVTGTASAVHAADWDGDGDLDLLVGDIEGALWWIPNEGTRTAWSFAKERRLHAGGEPLTVPGGDAGPFAVDWDADGDLDIVVGGGDGSVQLFENTGNAKRPELARARTLVERGEVRFGNAAPAEPRRGQRAKVCVTDWNGDGRLDLLVGDMATQKPSLPEPTPEERARYEQVRAEIETVEQELGPLSQRLHGPRRERDPKQREALEARWKEIFEKLSMLRSRIPPESETHGWVWLFLRKPAKPAR